MAPGTRRQVSARSVRASLLWSGLRWRGRSSLAMFAVAVFAAGAAAFGSIYLHSTDQLVLGQTTAAAPAGGAGLSIQGPRGEAPLPALRRAVARVPRPHGGRPWFDSPIYSQFAGFTTTPEVRVTPGSGPQTARLTYIPYGGTRPYVGSLVSRTGICAHLHMVAGTCLGTPGTVVISTRTADLLALSVGQTMNVGFAGTARSSTQRPSIPAALLVGGVYAPGNPDASYWWGQNFFPFGARSSASVGSTVLVQIDDVFAAPGTVRREAPANRITALAQVPYDQGSLGVDAVGAFTTGLHHFDHVMAARAIRVSTELFALLAQAAGIEHTASTVVAVVDLQLVLLAVFVLYFVASRTAAAREPDVRLAELRGYRYSSTVAVALAEPLVLVTVAVPVGLVGAWLLASALAPAVWGGGVGASITTLALLAALAAGGTGLLAAALAGRHALMGGAAVVPGAERHGTRAPWGLVAEVGAVVLAAAAFMELVVVGDPASRGAGGDPLAALAPGLLAVAIGVVMARALPAVLRALQRRAGYSHRVGVHLASRLVARRREHAAAVVLVAVAVALTVFAVSGWAIAGYNRAARARYAVGAPTVLTVGVRTGVTFEAAVRAADPSGREAMAAVLEHASDGTTLAVDASRLAAVATWPGTLEMSARQVARQLVPSGLAPPVIVAGTTLALAVDTTTAAPRGTALSVDLFNITHQTLEQVTLGTLDPGLHTYHGSLAYLCPGGCRIIDVALSWAPATGRRSTEATVNLSIRSIREQGAGGRWRTVAAGLGDSRRWTSPSGGVQLLSTGPGLAARFRLDPYGSPVTVGPADMPRAVPVVVTPATRSFASGDGGPLIVGLDGSTEPGHSVGQISALPQAGANAVLANLSTAELFEAGPFSTATAEVWVAAGAPHDLRARLAAQGLTVLQTTTESARVGQLAHSGISLAYLLYLAAAVAAVVLVVVAVAFAAVAGARRRQAELAALRAVGVDARSLRRSVVIEQVTIAGTGLVVGVVSGAVAAAVAMRSIPEFAASGAGPPLALGLPVLALVATGVIVLAALAATTLLSAHTLQRGATPDRLSGGS